MPIRRSAEEIAALEEKRKEMEANYNPLSDFYKFESNKEELYNLNDNQLEELKHLAIEDKRYQLARIVKLEQRKREMNLEKLPIDELWKLENQAITDEDFDLVLLIKDVMFWKFMKKEEAERNFFGQNTDNEAEISGLVEKLNK